MIHAKRSNNPTARGIEEALTLTAREAKYVTTVSVNNAGMVNEAIQIARQYDAKHFVCFRPAGYRNGFNMDVPGHNYQDTPEYAADEYARALLAYLPPELDSECWVICWNEIDKNQLEYCSEIALRMALDSRIAHLRLLFFGFNAGEPEPHQLDQPRFKAFAEYAQANSNRIGIALHEYTFNWTQPMRDFIPYLIGRCGEIIKRYPGIKIGVTEFGYGRDGNSVPSQDSAIADFEEIVPYYKELGVELLSLWYDSSETIWLNIGKWLNNDSNSSLDLISNMARITVDNAPYGGGGTPPVGEHYKAVVLKLAQEHDNTVWGNAGKWAERNYKRDIVASHHTAGNICLTSGQVGEAWGGEESYVIIVDENLASQMQTKSHLQNLGVKYTTMTSQELVEAPSIPNWEATYRPQGKTRYSQGYGVNPERYPMFGDCGHEGDDTPDDNGAPVYAPASGLVYRSDNASSAYGEQIRIDVENGFKIILAHLSNRKVSSGERVTAGQVIGHVGSTGNSSGPHVHLSLKYAGATERGLTCHPNDFINPRPHIHNNLPIPDTKPPPDPTPPGNINAASFMIAEPNACRVIKHVAPSGHETNEEVWDIATPEGWICRRKNNNAEWWKYDNNYAYLLFDTSHDETDMYFITKNGVLGAPKNPIMVSHGQSWIEQGTHHVQFKNKDSCANSRPDISGNATNSAKITLKGRTIFNSYGQNFVVDEVLEIDTGNEIQLYAKKDGVSIGWIGWRSSWGFSEIVELHYNRTPPSEADRHCSL